jgi:tetratricopeptide (TPR) repeat protein
MGDHDGAIQDLKRVVRLNPNFYSLWFNLGAAYYLRGRLINSKRAYERALQLGHPKTEEIEKMLRQIDAKLGD